MSKRNEREKQGLTVPVYDNDVSKAMRKLKKKMQTEKVFQDFKKKEFYEKPSLKRKRARASARKRHLKEVAKRNQH
jgi:small subunit ribosomal protein S21